MHQGSDRPAHTPRTHSRTHREPRVERVTNGRGPPAPAAPRRPRLHRPTPNAPRLKSAAARSRRRSPR
eukprot:2471481-Prymnesium_polylepis.1